MFVDDIGEEKWQSDLVRCSSSRFLPWRLLEAKLKGQIIGNFCCGVRGGEKQMLNRDTYWTLFAVASRFELWQTEERSRRDEEGRDLLKCGDGEMNDADLVTAPCDGFPDGCCTKLGFGAWPVVNGGS
ncbi:hypothetical protein QYF36_011647 [Acer negundo]|nr:hypothetical protein QYF36_011647 [Acer negundo]